MPAMIALAEMQARLQAGILDDAVDFADVQPLLKQGDGGVAPERGMSVYHGAYRARLRDVLGSVFERTWAYVGDAEFETVCERHIAECPSRHPNLRGYGSALPGLMQRLLPDDPEAAEIAIMDWNLHAAFDAPNAPALDPAVLGALSEDDWQQLAFVFHPAVSVAAFEWNARDIWHAINRDTTPPVARRLECPDPHLFWRNEMQGHFRSMDPAEYGVFAMLLSGATFASACEWLAASHPDREDAVGSWLARWLEDELISDLRFDPV